MGTERVTAVGRKSVVYMGDDSTMGMEELKASQMGTPSPSVPVGDYAPSPNTCSQALLRANQLRVQALLRQLLAERDPQRLDTLRVLRRTIRELDYHLSWLAQIDLLETIERLLRQENETDTDWRLINDCTQLLIESIPRLPFDLEPTSVKGIFSLVVENLGHQRSELRRSSLLLINMYINERPAHFQRILKLFIEHGLANHRNQQAQRGAILSIPLLMSEQVVEGQDLTPLIRCLSELLVEANAQLFYSLYLAMQRLHLTVGDHQFAAYLRECDPEATLLYKQAASRNNSLATAGSQSPKRQSSSFQQHRRQSSSSRADPGSSMRQESKASASVTETVASKRHESVELMGEPKQVTFEDEEQRQLREEQASALLEAEQRSDDTSDTQTSFADEQVAVVGAGADALADVTRNVDSEYGVGEDETSLINNDSFKRTRDDDLSSDVSSISTLAHQHFGGGAAAASSPPNTDGLAFAQFNQSSVSSTCSSEANLVDPSHYMSAAALSGRPLSGYEQIHHIDHSRTTDLAINDMGVSCTPTIELGPAPQSELKFGIFPRHLITASLASRYPDRIEALEELMCIIRDSPVNHLAILMTYFDSFLEQFLARLLESSGADYKVELIAIDMIETIVIKTKVSTMQYVRPIIGLLIKTLADSRSIMFRENTVRVIHKMMAFLPPQHVIDALFEHKHSKSALIREECVNRVTGAVLEYDRQEFNLTKLCYHVLPMLADHHANVRLASLECIASLAHVLGHERIGSLLTAAEAVQTGCDYDGLLDAIHARLMRRSLPRCNPDGSIRYVIKPFLNLANANYHQEHRAADVRWVLEAPSTHQHPGQHLLHHQQQQLQHLNSPSPVDQHHHHRLGVYSPPNTSRRRSSIGGTLNQLVGASSELAQLAAGETKHEHHHHHHHHQLQQQQQPNQPQQHEQQRQPRQRTTGGSGNQVGRSGQREPSSSRRHSVAAPTHGNGQLGASNCAPSSEPDGDSIRASDAAVANRGQLARPDRQDDIGTRGTGKSGAKSETNRSSNNNNNDSRLQASKGETSTGELVEPNEVAPASGLRSSPSSSHDSDVEMASTSNRSSRRKLSSMHDSSGRVSLATRSRRSNSQESTSSSDTNKVLFQYYLSKFKQSLRENGNSINSALPSDSIIYTDASQAYALTRRQSRYQQTSLDYEVGSAGRQSNSINPVAGQLSSPTEARTSQQLVNESDPLSNVGLSEQTPRGAHSKKRLEEDSSSSRSDSPLTVMEANPGNRRFDTSSSSRRTVSRRAKAENISDENSPPSVGEQSQQAVADKRRQSIAASLKQRQASSDSQILVQPQQQQQKQTGLDSVRRKSVAKASDQQQSGAQIVADLSQNTDRNGIEPQASSRPSESRRSLQRSSATVDQSPTETSPTSPVEAHDRSRGSLVRQSASTADNSTAVANGDASSSSMGSTIQLEHPTRSREDLSKSERQDSVTTSDSHSSQRNHSTQTTGEGHDRENRRRRSRRRSVSSSRRRESHDNGPVERQIESVGAKHVAHARREEEADRETSDRQQQDGDEADRESQIVIRRRASKSQPPVARQSTRTPSKSSLVQHQNEPTTTVHNQSRSNSRGPESDSRRAISVSPSVASGANVNIRQILENVAELEGPFQEPQLAFKVAMDALEGPCWSTKVEGLLALIRLASFHQPIVLAHLHEVIGRTVAETRNLRSTVSRSAIFALGDLSAKLKRSLEPELEAMVQALLNKSIENTAFIRDDIRRALSTMVDNLTQWRLANALINHGSNHRNVQVRRMASQFVAMLAQRMGAAKCLVGARDISAQLIPAAAKFAQDSSPHTRYYGRLVLALLMQHTAFDRLLRKNLTPNLYRSTLGIIESVKRRGPGEPPADN